MPGQSALNRRMAAGHVRPPGARSGARGEHNKGPCANATFMHIRNGLPEPRYRQGLALAYHTPESVSWET